MPAGPGEMGLGESISHLMGREGSFDEKIDAARFHKEKGNALLNSGDYEDALRMYEAGLKLVTFHERAMAMVKLPPADLEAIAAVRVPLLLNAVLCELRMNPEEGNGRLETAEERIADVLKAQPQNTKALFRRAQLHGRAGEYEESRAILERLCRQDPHERAFRAELKDVASRVKAAQSAQKAFWSGALDRLDVENRANDVEGGLGAAVVSEPALIARLVAALRACVLRLWPALLRRRRHEPGDRE